MFSCPFANRLYREFELLSGVDVKFGSCESDRGTNPNCERCGRDKQLTQRRRTKDGWSHKRGGDASLDWAVG